MIDLGEQDKGLLYVMLGLPGQAPKKLRPKIRKRAAPGPVPPRSLFYVSSSDELPRDLMARSTCRATSR